MFCDVLAVVLSEHARFKSRAFILVSLKLEKASSEDGVTKELHEEYMKYIANSVFRLEIFP